MGQGKNGGKANMFPVQLSEPITHGEEEYRVLEIRKPRAADLRDMPMEPRVGDILNVAAELAGVPYSVMDDLCWADMEKVMDVVANFMPAGRKTGGKK